MLACRIDTSFLRPGADHGRPRSSHSPHLRNSDTGGVDGDETNADAPVITEAYAFHDELPQIGPVIEMHILYNNPR